MRLLMLSILAALTVGVASGQPAATQPTSTGTPVGDVQVTRPGLIGVINYADGGAKVGAKNSWKTERNPHGWNAILCPPDLDLRDQKSWVQFQLNYQKFTLDSFDHGDRIGVEGYLLWDCEGAQHPDATYVGDPTMVPDCVGRSMIKFLVAEAKKRNKKIGFTFRDKNPVMGLNGGYQAPGDPAEILITKLQRARFTYGNDIQLAYLDDVCEPDTWSDGKAHPRPANKMAPVFKLPNWTYLMEFGSPEYDQFSNVRSLRWQQATDSANGKKGDLGPKVSAREILVPFDGTPNALQLGQFKREVQAGAFGFVCITWDRPDTKWVPKFFAPKPLQ